MAEILTRGGDTEATANELAAAIRDTYHYLHAGESLKAPCCKLFGMQTRADGKDPGGPRANAAAINRPRARTVV